MAGVNWSKEEIEVLISKYPTGGIDSCVSLLPSRTKRSISQRATRLGLRCEIVPSQLKSMESYAKWVEDNTDYKVLESYKTSMIPILHRHEYCDTEWKACPNNIKRGTGCPTCKKTTPFSTHEEYLVKLSQTEFEVLERYAGSKVKALHRHINCGHEWYATPNNILRGQGCPACSRKPYSKIAMKWLNSFNNPNILHAENGGEQLVAGFRVDGYDPNTNTVYEFHGDAFHGNLDLYDPEYTCHPFDKTVTADQLWQKTFDKMLVISKQANLIYIWENDFKKGKSYEIF